MYIQSVGIAASSVVPKRNLHKSRAWNGDTSVRICGAQKRCSFILIFAVATAVILAGMLSSNIGDALTDSNRSIVAVNP